jgi:hypothetical protein
VCTGPSSTRITTTSASWLRSLSVQPTVHCEKCCAMDWGTQARSFDLFKVATCARVLWNARPAGSSTQHDSGQHDQLPDEGKEHQHVQSCVVPLYPRLYWNICRANYPQ